MSMEIDERVVKIEFDNSRFEKNTQQSISTIEKLKNSLKFDGAKQGFDDIDKAQSKISFKAMVSGLDGLAKKFSALEVIGVTALANITNSVVNTGKRMVKSLTIDQVTSGWAKYEEKTTSVQTIMSAIRNDFEDQEQAMKAVNEQLERLVWFTDETSYSLTDMTSNIGKFVANKVPLEEAATAMQGISVWAASAGQNASAASRVMYNLSQALGTGAVKLQDWMSIENANMATAEFKQLVIDTAKELGVLNSTGGFGKVQVTAENFRNTLSEGWFNKDVLNAALSKYGHFADVLYTATEKTGYSATELLKVIDEYKKSAGGLSDAGSQIDATLGDIAKRVIKGEFGKGEARRGALEAMGIDPDKVQNEVNRIYAGLKASEESISVLPEKLTDIDTGNLELLSKISEETGIDAAELKKMLDELASSENDLGYNAFKAAQEAKTFSDAMGAIKDGVSTAWMNIFETIFGDYLTSKKLWTDLANWGYDVFAEPINRLGEAVKTMKKMKVFDDLKVGFRSIKKYVDDLTDPFRTVFKDLFADLFHIDIFRVKSLSMRFKIWAMNLKVSEQNMKRLKNVAEAFGNIVRKIHLVGSKVSSFIWNISKGAFNGAITWIKKCTNKTKNFLSTISKSSALEKFRKSLSNLFSTSKEERFKKLQSSFTNLKNILVNFFSGLSLTNFKNKLEVLRDSLTEWFAPMGEKINGIKTALRGFFEEVLEVLKQFGIDLSATWGTIKKVFKAIKEYLARGGIGGLLSAIFGSLMAVGLYKLIKRIASLFIGIEDILKSVNGVLGSIKGVFTAISGYIKEKTFKQLSNNLLKLAASVALIVAAILAITLLVPAEKEAMLVEASIIVAGIIVALGYMMNMFATIGKDKKSAKGARSLANSIFLVASALALVAAAFYVMTNEVDFTNIDAALFSLVGSIAVIAMISIALNKSADKFKGGVLSILVIAEALNILSRAFRKLKEIEPDVIFNTGLALAACSIGLSEVVKAAGASADSAKAILAASALSVSVFLFVKAIQEIVELVKTYFTENQFWKTIGIISGIIAGIIGFMWLTSKMANGPATWQFGVSVLALTGALAGLTALFKIIMSFKGNTDAAFVVLTGLILLTGLLAGCLSIVGDTAKTSVKGIGGLALAVGGLALVAAALGQMNFLKMGKGVLGVGTLLIALGTALRLASKYANSIDFKSIIAFGVVAMAISVMVGIFTGIPIESLAPVVGLMGALLLALGYSLQLAAKEADKIKIKSIIAMVGMIAALSAALIILTKVIESPKDVIPIAIGLGALMLALSGAFAITAKIGEAKLKDIAKGILGILMVITALVALAGALWVIDKMDLDGKVIKTALQLTGLMAILGALSAELAIIGITGLVGLSSALSGLGMLALTLVGLIAVAGAIWVIQKMDISGAIPTTKSLIGFTAILGALAVELAALGLGGLIGGFVAVAAGIGMMLEAMAGLALVALAVWGLGSLIESNDINAKADSVIAFAGKLGETFGAFISGIVDKGTEGLIAAGEHIATMWENMTPFIEGIKSNQDLASNIESFSKGILSLTESGVLNKISDFFGDSAFDSIGKDLAGFAANLQPLADLGSNDALLAGANAVGQLGMAVQNFGDYKRSMTQWTKNLPEFVGMLSGLPDVNTEYIDHIIDAATKLKTLVDSYNEIFQSGDSFDMNGPLDLSGLTSGIDPNGKLQKGINWVNENVPGASDAMSSLANSNFGLGNLMGAGGTNTATNLLSFGNSINSFASGMDAFLNLDTSHIDDLKTDMEKLKPIIAEFITGNNTSTFKAQLTDISTSVADLSAALSDATIADYANSVSQALYDMRTTIDDFTGNTDVEAFKIKIVEIRDALASLMENQGPLNDAIKNSILPSFEDGGVSAAEQAKNGINESMSTVASTIVSDFFSQMSLELSASMPTYFEEIATGMIAGVATNAETFGHVGSAMAMTALSGMRWHIDDFKTAVQAMSEELMTALNNGENVEENASVNIDYLAQAFETAVMGKYSDFVEAGKMAGDGLVSGLLGRQGSAYAAGQALANQVINAINTTFDIHSPSHVLFGSGEFAGLGLINGLISMRHRAGIAGREVANESINSINSVIAGVSQAMASDEDMQPVIRPVVDLSNVEEGAGKIGSLFGRHVGIGATSYKESQKVSSIRGDSEGIQNSSGNGPTYVNNNNIYPQQLNNATVDYMFNLFDSRLGAKI